MLLESISRASCELCHASTLLGRLTARQENCASQPGVLRNRFGQAKSASTNLTSFRHVVFENGRAAVAALRTAISDTTIQPQLSGNAGGDRLAAPGTMPE